MNQWLFKSCLALKTQGWALPTNVVPETFDVLVDMFKLYDSSKESNEARLFKMLVVGQGFQKLLFLHDEK